MGRTKCPRGSHVTHGVFEIPALEELADWALRSSFCDDSNHSNIFL